MDRRHLIAVVGLVQSVGVGAACARPHYVIAAPRPAVEREWPVARVTTHVLLISVDGLRPDAIGAFPTPTLDRLIREGSYTLTASTIMPSKTLPSHTSMLTGQPPERHGVLWNNVVTADAAIIDSTTVFGAARAHGYRTAAFFSKAKFRPLQQPGTLDYSQAPGGWFGRWDSDRTVGDASKYLSGARPNLLFVHLSDPDRAGHGSGWMSVPYGRAVSTADAAIGRLLSAADTAFGQHNYTVIVTADHGGHGYDHGSDDPRDVRIPWIAWGRGVTPRQLIGTAISTTDTASTVLWLLGVDEPGEWLGAPVVNAFMPRPDAGAAVHRQR